MIAALWSNSNYDGGEDGQNPRQEAIDDIEEKCADAIQIIQTGIDPDEEVEQEDTYGFFAAGKRGQAKLYAKSDLEDPTVAEVVDYTKFIDQ